jgi:2-polyprenyl-3-methyl-5-hydroxy-6-metoxy-1,4-benzoquinol methylase
MSADLINSNAPAKAFFAEQSRIWSARYESRTYRQRRTLIREFVQQYLGRLNLETRGIEVLDFGCGTGVLLKDIAELGVDVIGVDNSEPMIEAARLHVGNMCGRVTLEYISNDLAVGAYQDRIYDVVLCISVLEFVADLQAVLSCLCACVAPGGVLILSIPNGHSWLRTLEKFMYRHPALVQHLRRLKHLADPDCYLNIQKHQLTLDEIKVSMKQEGLRKLEHRFCSAPKVLCRLERVERIGMMLVAVFQK